MKQPNRNNFFLDLHVHLFPEEFCVAGGTVLFVTARLRDDAEMFERGIQEFASFSFCMKGSNNVFI